MSRFALQSGTAAPGVLAVDPREATQRLGYPYNGEDALIRRATEALRGAVQARYAFRESPLCVEGDLCRTDFGVIASRHLAKNLRGCDRVYILGVTLGSGVDRLLSRLSLTDAALAFTADALASAMTEALCDYAQALCVGQEKHRPRFSPGYGDCALEIQPALLAFLESKNTLGITLTEHYFMKPCKSVTAFIGKENA